MIGTLIGGALSVGGSIVGSILSARANRQAEKLLDARQQSAEQELRRKIAEDPTQRADAQQLLKYTREQMLANNRRASGMAAVTGGSEESVAAAKGAGTAAVADAVSNINTAGEARRDALESQLAQRQDAYAAQKAQLKAQRGAMIGQAVSAAGSAFAGMGESVDDYLAGKKTPKQGILQQAKEAQV